MSLKHNVLGMLSMLMTSSLILIYVVMMILTVKAGEEDCLGTWGQPPIRCYECSTNNPDHFCSDPFNKTHPEVQTVICKEYCVKWTRTTLSGKIYVQRTCSSSLQIKMRKNTVCVQESRPSSGQICFCDKDECNDATMTSSSLLTITSFLAFFHWLLGGLDRLPVL